MGFLDAIDRLLFWLAGSLVMAAGQAACLISGYTLTLGVFGVANALAIWEFASSVPNGRSGATRKIGGWRSFAMMWGPALSR